MSLNVLVAGFSDKRPVSSRPVSPIVSVSSCLDTFGVMSRLVSSRLDLCLQLSRLGLGTSTSRAHPRNLCLPQEACPHYMLSAITIVLILHSADVPLNKYSISSLASRVSELQVTSIRNRFI